MTEVTQILSQIEAGDRTAQQQLFALVYEELRRLARAKMAMERPDHTFTATALVHEAYLRLVDVDEAQHWNSRGHFFSAAAEAMRRILVNRARDKKRLKRGGNRQRIDLDQIQVALDTGGDDLIALDEALEKLAAEDPTAAQVVKLRFFVGLAMREVAAALGLSQRTTEREWAYARAWLYHALRGEDTGGR